MKSKDLALLLLFVIIGIGLWSLMLILTWQNDGPNNELLIDMGKTGASLALLTVIGGMVQQIMKNREKELQEKKEEINFYRNILADLKSVYDKVERARLLIPAHQTAKTYGEQMRELIDGVVILHNIERATDPEFLKLQKALEPNIRGMDNFIQELLTEYSDQFKPISILQEIDEARKKVIKEEKGKSANPELSMEDIPANAWQKILALEKLNILINKDSDEKYEANFKVYLNNASAILRRKIPVTKEK